MKRLSTRRQALTTGIAAAGAFAAPMGRQAEAWPPGPDENLRRDLKPGKTPVLLSTVLKRPNSGTIRDMMKGVRETGHTAVFVYPSYWNGLSGDDIRLIKESVDEFGMKVFEFGGYVNMLHPDTATRQRYLKSLATCFETAEALDCPMVGTISGTRDTHHYGINPHPDNWTMETWRLLIDGVKQVLKDTSGSKVVLGMEAQVTTNLDGPKAHLRLMEDVGDERCAVNLDPVNMVSLNRYYHTTELINECFDLLGERIYGCHAKDSYVLPDKQTVQIREVCPGRGVLDYETYLVRMSRMEWPRAIHPEHLPDDQYPEADAYIRSVAERVGVTIPA